MQVFGRFRMFDSRCSNYEGIRINKWYYRITISSVECITYPPDHVLGLNLKIDSCGIMKDRRFIHRHRKICAFFPGFFFCLLFTANATNRYLSAYLSYGTGDTFISTPHMGGGPSSPNRKWNVECLDGTAMVGIMDQSEDFNRIAGVWCRFMFPYKPPSNGLYPYYPSCVLREYQHQFFCFETQNASITINTFITAFWDNGPAFWAATNTSQPYKCCKAPKGYYIDYVSCYYVPTHDLYYEFYDSMFHFIVYCGTGYVMTGIAKKLHPVHKTEYNIDWIQCCRVGYGFPSAFSPPIIRNADGRSTFYSTASVPPVPVPRAYQQHNPALRVDQQADFAANQYANASNAINRRINKFDNIRYKREAIPVQLSVNGQGLDGFAAYDYDQYDGREFIMRSLI